MNPLALNRYGTAEQQCVGKARYPRKLRYGLTVYRCKLDRRHWHVTSRRRSP